MARLEALEQVLVATEAVLGARGDQMLTRVELSALEEPIREANDVAPPASK